MKAVMVLFDSLNRHMLPNYGCDWTKMPNFERLGKNAITFENFYAGSLPCMPARKELHTGRYNFLHRSWGPMEPYDESVMTKMKQAGIYTHISTDHFHYWEEGGMGYLNKFDSFKISRGQQGDPWIGQVERPKNVETLSKRKDTENFRHDWVNRSFLTREEVMPQALTFKAGLDFIERNHPQDQWFLQIETFDPHEPFYTQQQYKDLYSHEYTGKHMDWPDYGKNELTKEETEHVRYEYASLMSMCDAYLGKVIDLFDKHNLWKDTMLIVSTDHGFMLGEKEWMGKNVQPFFNEIVHIPFFIYDPRNPIQNERRNSLAQTIDITATLVDFFKIEAPKLMNGKSLTPAIKNDEAIREAALFGMHGGHVNVTDGRYVYMHAPTSSNNKPLYEYTLMPAHMNTMFSIDELKEIELTDEFEFTKGAQVMKIPANTSLNTFWHGTKLYDLERDPNQENPIEDSKQQIRMIEYMRKLMIENECPKEQFERLSIPIEGHITVDMLDKYTNSNYERFTSDKFQLTDKAEKACTIYVSSMCEENQEAFRAILHGRYKVQQQPLELDVVLECIKEQSPPQIREMMARIIRGYVD